MNTTVDQTDIELINYAKAVAQDGRFVKEFVNDPQAPAANLGIALSQDAKDRLKVYGIKDLVSKGGGQTLGVAHLAIVAIIVLTKTDPNQLILDKSGQFKI